VNHVDFKMQGATIKKKL